MLDPEGLCCARGYVVLVVWRSMFIGSTPARPITKSHGLQAWQFRIDSVDGDGEKVNLGCSRYEEEACRLRLKKNFSA